MISPRNKILMTVVVVLSLIIVIVAMMYPIIKSKMMFMSSKRLLRNIKDEFFVDGRISCELLKCSRTEVVRGISYTTIFLFSHGNGGNITYYDYIVDMLRVYGDVLIYDYPGYGNSKGVPTYESVLESGVKVCEYILSKLRNVYKRVVLYGFSLGGCVTLEIASRIPRHQNIHGVILQSTFFNIEDCVPLVGEYLVGDVFRSSGMIPRITYPVCIIHSEEDEVVPYSSGVKLFEHAPQPKYFYKIHSKHNSPIDETSILHSLRFLEVCSTFKDLYQNRNKE